MAKPTIKLAEAVTENQAVVNTASLMTGEPGAATEDARFQGFAEYGGAAGDLITLRNEGEGPFIAGEALVVADINAKLKLGASGRLVKADADDRYVAVYKPRNDHATAGILAIGEHGWCLIEKGVA